MGICSLVKLPYRINLKVDMSMLCLQLVSLLSSGQDISYCRFKGQMFQQSSHWDALNSPLDLSMSVLV